MNFRAPGSPAPAPQGGPPGPAGWQPPQWSPPNPTPPAQPQGPPQQQQWPQPQPTPPPAGGPPQAPAVQPQWQPNGGNAMVMAPPDEDIFAADAMAPQPQQQQAPQQGCTQPPQTFQQPAQQQERTVQGGWQQPQAPPPQLQQQPPSLQGGWGQQPPPGYPQGPGAQHLHEVVPPVPPGLTAITIEIGGNVQTKPYHTAKANFGGTLQFNNHEDPAVQVERARDYLRHLCKVELNRLKSPELFG